MSLIPSGDGEVEFKWAQAVYNGHFLNGPLSHPPFKLLLFDLFFKLFGSWSISAIGFLLGALGIYALYRIAEELFDKKVALLSAFLLATSGLYTSRKIDIGKI